MPRHSSLLAALLLASAGSARAQAAPPPAGPPISLDDDPALAKLVEESLGVRPELAAARAGVRAADEQVPQAGALPDPVLSLGIQNDGFDAIQIGKMETSFWSIGLAQTLPFPGKRGLREDAARQARRGTDALLSRARLTAEADVRRAYLDLLLVRDRLGLLARLEALWARSEGTARARYESGEGAQTDLLRSQLERTRLKQRRVSLEAEERARRAVANRLRGRPAGDPVETAPGLEALVDPGLPAMEAALSDAEARSPELAQARADADRAHSEEDLARRERFPDLTLNAALMPRGGLVPMWAAGVSVTLPIWAGAKQARAVDASAARAEAGRASATAVEEVVRLRALERQEALAALLDTLRLYRGGLLVQSRATVESALAQYRVGRVPFAAVLEAVVGNVNDEEAFLSTAADAQRLHVAAAEVSVAESLPGGAAAGGGAMPGAGGGATPARGGGAGGGAAKGAEAASSSSSSMGGGM